MTSKLCPLRKRPIPAEEDNNLFCLHFFFFFFCNELKTSFGAILIFQRQIAIHATHTTRSCVVVYNNSDPNCVWEKGQADFRPSGDATTKKLDTQRIPSVILIR